MGRRKTGFAAKYCTQGVGLTPFQSVVLSVRQSSQVPEESAKLLLAELLHLFDSKSRPPPK